MGTTKSPTLVDWLERWITTYAPLRCRSLATTERYSTLSRYLLVTDELRTVSETSIDRLTRAGLQAAIVSLIAWPAKRRDHLSPRTVCHFAALLRVSLERAARLDIIDRNPMAGVELPSFIPCGAAARSLTASEIRRLREVCQGDWTGAFVELALATGCRRGELLAIEWPDVDGRVLTIRRSLSETSEGLSIKTPKSGRARRCTLPRVALEALARVTNPRLVFADPATGTYRIPSLVSQVIVRRLQTAGIDGASLHTLRHTHASLLLSGGVPLPAVSARLGHSSPNTTARIYAHALPLDDERAAQEWDRLLLAS